MPSKIAPSAGPCFAVLGQARGEMGVVVLHAHELDPVEFECVLGREILGMQVVGHEFRLDREQPLEVGDALLERPQGLVVLKVADVVANPRPRALGHAERVLELGATGKHGTRRAPTGEGYGRRDVSARAPEHHRACQTSAHDRVVGARLDWPVVDEDGIGDVLQALEGVLVAVSDRLVGHVAAREHERGADVGEQ